MSSFGGVPGVIRFTADATDGRLHRPRAMTMHVRIVTDVPLKVYWRASAFDDDTDEYSTVLQGAPLEGPYEVEALGFRALNAGETANVELTVAYRKG